MVKINERSQAVSFLLYRICWLFGICLISDATEPTFRTQYSPPITLFQALRSVLFYNNGTVRATDQFEDVNMAVSYNEPDNVTWTGKAWSVRNGSWTYPWQVANSLHNSTKQDVLKEASSHGYSTTDYVAPPFGIRSAPQLGGISTGSVELRADGSFREWTILNAGPTGNGKYGLVDDVFMAAKVGNIAKVIRTHPPANLHKHGLKSIQFSGMYPVTQLNLDSTEFEGADLSLYAYSTFKPMDLKESAFPALTLSLTIANPTVSDIDVSFMLNLPWSAMTDCIRSDSLDLKKNPNVDKDRNINKFESESIRTCQLVNVTIDQDIPGNDLPAGPFKSDSFENCATACCGNPECKAFLFEAHSDTATNDCEIDKGCCWLKSKAQNPRSKPSADGAVHATIAGLRPHVSDCAAACMHECHNSSECQAWTFLKKSKLCHLFDSDVATAHSPESSYCGTRNGGWETHSDGQSISLNHDGHGPSSGNITLRVVGGNASFMVGDDTYSLFQNFASLNKNKSYVKNGAIAANAAATVSTTVPAGKNKTLSIIFAWYFPNRDFDHTILGNGYGDLFTDSDQVALALSKNDKLLKVVTDINTHHDTIAGPLHPAPDWLKDMLLNQWAHAHMTMWYADGRTRWYEAYSCPDVDSVHNDYQRHLLYLWMLPEAEEQKLQLWSSQAMAKDGHVEEWLAPFCACQPMDQAGGRVMGDTTSLYILELFEIWRNTGNGTLALSYWTSIQSAVRWMISNAMGSDGYGLPQYITTTYDHFGWEHSRSVVYNAHIYLTALRAARYMAEGLKGDLRLLVEIDNATAIAQQALPRLFWRPLTNSFRATAEGNQTFTDSLYGQMLAHHHFGNFSYNQSRQLWKHLEYEWIQNQDQYGMRVLSNPVQEDSIWMNGPPTWTYLQLSRLEKNTSAIDLETALEPLKRMVENYRSRLRDIWNLRALTHTQTEGTLLEHGAPREQGHYAFMLTDLYLLPLFSGVRSMIENKYNNDGSVRPNEGSLKLMIEPTLIQPPFKVPVLLYGFEGSLSAESNGSKVSLELASAFGTLKLPAGGLWICGKSVNADRLILVAGTSFSWTQSDVVGCGWSI